MVFCECDEPSLASRSYGDLGSDRDFVASHLPELSGVEGDLLPNSERCRVLAGDVIIFTVDHDRDSFGGILEAAGARCIKLVRS